MRNNNRRRRRAEKINVDFVHGLFFDYNLLPQK